MLTQARSGGTARFADKGCGPARSDPRRGRWERLASARALDQLPGPSRFDFRGATRPFGYTTSGVELLPEEASESGVEKTIDSPDHASRVWAYDPHPHAPHTGQRIPVPEAALNAVLTGKCSGITCSTIPHTTR